MLQLDLVQLSERLTDHVLRSHRATCIPRRQLLCLLRLLRVRLFIFLDPSSPLLVRDLTTLLG